MISHVCMCVRAPPLSLLLLPVSPSSSALVTHWPTKILFYLVSPFCLSVSVSLQALFLCPHSLLIVPYVCLSWFLWHRQHAGFITHLPRSNKAALITHSGQMVIKSPRSSNCALLPALVSSSCLWRGTSCKHTSCVCVFLWILVV